MILGGFGSHFGCQNGIKMDSKCDQKNDRFLERSWKGSEAPKGGLGRALGVSGEGGIGENPAAILQESIVGQHRRM